MPSNQLIDRGVKYTPAENVNPDFKKGFMDTVKNSQPRLALNYLIDILNEINERIVALENYLGNPEISDEDAVPDVEDTPPAKPAAKRTTKTPAAKAEADVEEV